MAIVDMCVFVTRLSVLCFVCLIPSLGFAASVNLSGSDADGYFAIVGFNAEPITEPSTIPTDPKFFDYPRYDDPQNIDNEPEDPVIVFFMSVEPYRFNLSYPNPLHPTGPGVFEDVESSFTEGLSEDADFSQFNIGTITYDENDITGVGQEVIDAANINMSLSGADFRSTNRTDLPGTMEDVPPFGPEGRTNFNEFANTVSLDWSNITGNGLTFQDGVLVSIDFSVTVSLNVTQAAFNGTILEGIPSTVTGNLNFSGNTFQFEIDEQTTLGSIPDIRLILNRTGTIDAVQSSGPAQAAVPIPFYVIVICFMLFAGIGLRRLH